jgi:hypothetical protein
VIVVSAFRGGHRANTSVILVRAAWAGYGVRLRLFGAKAFMAATICSVVAVVDGRGKLLRMQISPYAMRGLAAGELGRACTDAIAAARAAAATAMSDALKRLTGIDPDTAEAPKDLRQVWKQAGRATRWSR